MFEFAAGIFVTLIALIILMCMFPDGPVKEPERGDDPCVCGHGRNVHIQLGWCQLPLCHCVKFYLKESK